MQISISDIDYFVIYEDPFLKLGRQFQSTFKSLLRFNFANLRRLLKNITSTDYTTYDVAKRFRDYGLISSSSLKYFSEESSFQHHLSHASSAYYLVPFINVQSYV